MTYLPFYVGGAVLSAVVFVHYAWMHAQLGVSGRITTLVNRVRARAAAEPELSDAEMLEALRKMTEAEFGADAVGTSEPEVAKEPVVTAGTMSSGSHLLFLFGIAIGGFVVARLGGGSTIVPTLRGETFARLFGGSTALGTLPLFVGGVMVGFGTRMSGGCTSGHGLVGLPLLEPGSLLATAGFFGAGIATSFLLEVLR